VNADVDDLKKIQNQGNYEIGLDESIVYIIVMRKKNAHSSLLVKFLKIDGINFSEVSNNSMASSSPRSKLSHKFGLQDKNKANLPSHFEGFLTSFSTVGQFIYFKLKGVEERRLLDNFHNDFKNAMNKLCYTPGSKITNPVKGTFPNKSSYLRVNIFDFF